jgi:hypothetical protein
MSWQRDEHAAHADGEAGNGAMSYVNDDVGDTLRQLKHNLAAAQEREKSLRAHAADAEAEVTTSHDLGTISFSRASLASHSPTHLAHEWFTPTGTSCICSAHAPIRRHATAALACRQQGPFESVNNNNSLIIHA